MLDEVGELPLSVQAKLLRALQEGEISPVGSDHAQTVDVRVIACTNRDLAAEVKAHRFRADLYFRLVVVELVVPPLRDHREEIAARAWEFARRAAERFGAEDVRRSPALLEALQHADWPGNVRELENVMARPVALSPGGELGPEALALRPPSDFAMSPGEPAASPEAEQPGPAEPEFWLKMHLEALERGLLARMLVRTRGNQSEAARRLSISRSALIDRMKKYGLGGEGAGPG